MYALTFIFKYPTSRTFIFLSLYLRCIHLLFLYSSFFLSFPYRFLLSAGGLIFLFLPRSWNAKDIAESLESNLLSIRNIARPYFCQW